MTNGDIPINKFAPQKKPIETNRHHGENAKRILIVDAHPITLFGIQTLLKQQGYYGNLQTANNIKEAQLALNKGNIATVILVLELGVNNGFQLIEHIRRHHVKTSIIVYTRHQEPWVVHQLLSEDVNAVVLKEDDIQELLTALHKIEQGKGYFSNQFNRLIGTMEQLPSLSKRELEVLEHISNGLSTTDIATQLGITGNTVEFHRRNLMRKLHANNVAHMVKRAMLLGFKCMTT